MRTILLTIISFVFLFADTSHIGQRTVTAGESVKLALSLESNVNVRAVYLHYKTNIADEYTSVVMKNFGFDYEYFLQIPKDNYNRLEYY